MPLFKLELVVLEPRVGHHARLAIPARQLEHGGVDRVETGQGHELVLVPHGAQLALELSNRGFVQMAPPVERWRAVVGQHLPWEPGLNGLGKPPRLLQIRVCGLAPEQIGVRRVGQPASDRLVQPGSHVEESFRGPLAGQEHVVPLVDVVGQEGCGVGVGASDEHGGHTLDVRRQARGNQLVDGLAGRRQDLSTHMAALLEGRQLILEVDPRGARGNHRLRQLEGVQHTAEARLGVGYDGCEPVGLRFVLARFMGDLVGALERVVHPPDQVGYAVDGVDALVGIGLPGAVHVPRHLPAAAIDRRKPGLDHLHGLRASQRAECIHIWRRVQQVPEPPGPENGQGMLDLHRAA